MLGVSFLKRGIATHAYEDRALKAYSHVECADELMDKDQTEKATLIAYLTGAGLTS